MDNSQAQEIKNRTDIVEVVRESIPHLKPSGSNWKGVCPFHNEKTPSFMVSQDKQIWHCFGCNEGGDVFTFLMKIHGIEFIDALKQLADRAGIVLEQVDPAKASLRTKVLDIHTYARELYTKALLSKEGSMARNYLKSRGITKELVEELGIGLSSSAWSTLYDFLVHKGFTNKEIIASGLVLQNEKNKFFDRFRDRLMFSLLDSQGKIVGMAGRTLKKDADIAKYINSPQTIVYNKSVFLYGFYQARESIRKEDSVIIVEGYFDWIALYRKGYKNAVAVSGIALTEGHLALLKRYTKNILFALDTDEAGSRAQERSVMMTLSEDLVPFILDYKNHKGRVYKDPDELLLGDASLWNYIVEAKELALSYYIRKAKNALASNDVQIQKKAFGEILPFIQATKNAIDRDHFTKEISRVSGISVEAIKEEIIKVRERNDVTYAATSKELAPIRIEPITSPRQKRLYQWMALVLAHPKYFKYILAIIKEDEIYDDDIRALFSALHKEYKEKHKIPDYKVLQTKITIPTGLDKWLLTSDELFKDFDMSTMQFEVELLTKKIKEDYLRFSLQSLSKEIAAAETQANTKILEQLTKRHRTIIESLSNLLHQ